MIRNGACLAVDVRYPLGTDLLNADIVLLQQRPAQPPVPRRAVRKDASILIFYEHLLVVSDLKRVAFRVRCKCEALDRRDKIIEFLQSKLGYQLVRHLGP